MLGRLDLRGSYLFATLLESYYSEKDEVKLANLVRSDENSRHGKEVDSCDLKAHA